VTHRGRVGGGPAWVWVVRIRTSQATSNLPRLHRLANSPFSSPPLYLPSLHDPSPPPAPQCPTALSLRSLQSLPRCSQRLRTTTSPLVPPAPRDRDLTSTPAGAKHQASSSHRIAIGVRAPSPSIPRPTRYDTATGTPRTAISPLRVVWDLIHSIVSTRLA
jgi:hypothetical protein